MDEFTGAEDFELQQFSIISKFLRHRKSLIEFIFYPKIPKLKGDPEFLLEHLSGLCRTDQVLVRLALDLWSDTGGVRLTDLFLLDFEVYNEVLEALKALGPRPSSFSFRNLDSKV